MTRFTTIAIMIVSLLGGAMEINAVESQWFQTWDRPEYQEWALEIPEGYLLHIIRKEKSEWLVVQAKLIMGNKGLPGFEVIEQLSVSDEQDAFSRIHSWNLEQSSCAH